MTGITIHRHWSGDEIERLGVRYGGDIGRALVRYPEVVDQLMDLVDHLPPKERDGVRALYRWHQERAILN